jgi:hypothetical protein
VTYDSPSAIDDVDGVVPVTCAPASGSNFSIGTHTVNCDASDTAGNRSSSTFAVTVTYVPPPPPPSNLIPLSSFVALGRTQTWIQAGSQVVSGNVGALAHHGGAHGSDDEESAERDHAIEVRLGDRVTMEDPASHVAGDTVLIRNRALVYNVDYNELVGKGTIAGTQTSPLPVAFATLPLAPGIHPGTQNVTVARNQTLTLAAGRYASIHVSAKSTLVLTGGLYEIRSLDVDQNGTVLFKAAVDLRINGELDTDARAQLILDSSVAGLSAAHIRITVLGADSECAHHGLADDDDEPGPTAAHIGQDNTVTANIYVPNGTLWVRSRSNVTGALVADAIRISTRVTLRLASGF